jgi:hypothetical protein
MAAIKARKCFFPSSHWVYATILTCDNQLAVWFRRGVHHRHGVAYGGVPGVCCLYPTTQGELAEALYDLALVWHSEGKWVHHFLYRKLPYRIVSPPALPCGQCITSCSVTTSIVGNTVTINVTVTNNEGSPTKGEAPEGHVVIAVDGVQIADLALPEDEPDSKRSVTVSTTYTCTDGNAHTVTATYYPAATAGFLSTSCGASFQCPAQGVNTNCCPSNQVPATLHFTWTSADNPNLPATIAITNIAGTSQWRSGCIQDLTAGLYYRFTLECVTVISSNWSFSAGGNAPTADSAVCSPFALTFSNVGSLCDVNPGCNNLNTPGATFQSISVVP